MASELTHTELVNRACKWLRNTLNCRVVLAEHVAYTNSAETPDAVGWQHNRCFLVECKASKSDFFADRRKQARNWNRPQVLKDDGNYFPAIGHYRFYLTPVGLLDGLELPEGWGWYVVKGRRIEHAGGIEYKNTRIPPCTSDFQSERALLVSALAKRNGGKGNE